MMKIHRIILYVSLFMFFSLPANAMDGNDILGRCENVNRGMKTMKAGLQIRACFAGVELPLNGILYYKEPDRLKLSIPSIPEFIKSRKNLFSELIPRSFRREDYRSMIKEEKADCILLELTPRKSGSNINRALLWVDRNNYLIHRSRLFYRNGSEVLSNQSFTRYRGYYLPKKQNVDFRFPRFGGSAGIDYGDYEINIPVDRYFKS